MTLKTRLYKLCRDPCFSSCPCHQCHAEAMCVKHIIDSCLLILCAFLTILSWTMDCTLRFESHSSHMSYKIDYMGKIWQKHSLFEWGKREKEVKSTLCCSTLKLSIVLFVVVQFYIEFQIAMLLPPPSACNKLQINCFSCNELLGRVTFSLLFENTSSRIDNLDSF